MVYRLPCKAPPPAVYRYRLQLPLPPTQDVASAYPTAAAVFNGLGEGAAGTLKVREEGGG